MRFALAAVFLAACATVDSPTPRYDFSAVETRLIADCAAGAFSGVVAVSVNGERAFAHVCGLANVETSTPVTLDSTYRIFSSSKLLVALTAMRMAERGEIDLDAPVSRYIPNTPSAWSAITVRHLLQHTSGVTDFTNNYADAWCDAGGASAAIQALLTAENANSELAPQTPPGESYRYNNFTYEILAEVAERRARVPFAELIRREVFEPAGMRGAQLEQGRCEETTWISAEDPLLVTGYNGAADALEAVNPASFIQRGAGGVHANAADMLALGQALLDCRVVSEATWAEMTSNLQTPTPPTGNQYGFGVVVRSQPLRAYGHTGGSNGYVTYFDVLPDYDAVMVIMTNRSFANHRSVRDDIYAAFTAAAAE